MKPSHQSTGSTQPSNPQFVRQPTVLHEWNPVSPATLWRQIKVGSFPKPLKLSQGVTAWRLADLIVWASDPVSYPRKLRADGNKNNSDKSGKAGEE